MFSRAFNLSLFYILHLVPGTLFGCRRFVGVSEGNAVKQTVAFAETEFLEIGSCIGIGVDETDGTAQTARTDSHAPGRENHVFSKQSAVNLLAVVTGVVGNEGYGGGIAEHVFERGVFCSLGVGLFIDFCYSVNEFGIVHDAYFP